PLAPGARGVDRDRGARGLPRPLPGDRRLLALSRLRAGDRGLRPPPSAAQGLRLMALCFLFLFHGGHRLDAGTVLSWWTWEQYTVALLALAAGLYAAGLFRLWRRAGVGGGIRRWQTACFAAGWLALIAALLSPVDALGGILFSAHMAQHELLILVAAPLMVLGRPLAPMLWALPEPTRETAGRWSRTPAFAAGWRR